MISSLKDLKALMKLCREQGVDAFEIGEIKFNLGPLPQKPATTKKAQKLVVDDIQTPYSAGPNIPMPNLVPQELIKTDELSPTDLLFYSAGPNEQQ